MKVTKINNLGDLKTNDKRAVALGLFESVHKGHVALIEKCEQKAREHNLISTVVTVSSPVNKAQNPIFGIDHRIEKIENLAIDEMIILEMNDNIRLSSPDDFITFLKNISTEIVIVGADYRFGYRGSGDLSLLKEHFTLETQEYTLEGNDKVSTSAIKNSLCDGNIKHANSLLGYNYYIQGIVKKGKQLGRTIGVPTANIYPEIAPLATGVYLTKTFVGNNHYRSITNIGYNPTIGNNPLSVETYIGDEFNSEIYGQEIKVEMIEKIRDEVKFNSIEELKERLKLDIKYMEEYKNENS